MQTVEGRVVIEKLRATVQGSAAACHPGRRALHLLTVVTVATLVLAITRFEPSVVDAADPSLTVRTISLVANDLVYAQSTGQIFASIPSTAGPQGNSLVPIDPATGSVGTGTFVGSEPSKLAISDDGQVIYVALDGAAAVRRFDVASRTAGVQFQVGSDSFFGPMLADDIAVQPGSHSVVAVSRRNQCCSPRHMGVAMYEDGVQRTTTTPGHTGSNVIEFGIDPTRLYGNNTETSEYGFRRMDVSPSGVTTVDVTASLIPGSDFIVAGGRVYATSGVVVDPELRQRLGQFTLGTFGSQVAADPAHSRVYFLTNSGGMATLKAFDPNTFTPLWSKTIAPISGDVGSLIRWGQDRLAFRMTGGQVLLVTVDETSTPTPTSTPTSTATPTSTPTPPPVSCTPRPSIAVRTQADGGGGLVVTLEAGAASGPTPNSIRQVRFVNAQNAIIDLPGLAPFRGSKSVSMAAGRTTFQFTIHRAVQGLAVTVPLVVTDGCGEWPTLVGGGPLAF